MDGVYVSFSHGFTVSDTEDQHRVVVMYSTSTDDNEECTWGSMEERVILQAMAHILMETQYIDDGTQFDLNVLLTMNYGSWRELWVNAVQIGIG
jgi:hypothetical protein